MCPTNEKAHLAFYEVLLTYSVGVGNSAYKTKTGSLDCSLYLVLTYLDMFDCKSEFILVLEGINN